MTSIKVFIPIALLLIVLAVATLPVALQTADSASVDFVNYYGQAGMYDFRTDQELSELMSLSVFADVETTISHASTKHADDMSLYEKCLSGNNVIMAATDPTNNHCIEVFETNVEESGRSVKKWVVRVVKQVEGRWHEITAFSDEWEALYEVEDYLNRCGYMQIWP